MYQNYNSIKNIMYQKLIKNIYDNYNEPVNKYYFYWFKFILGSLYLWKLLSRDFSNLAFWPQDVISGYPIDIYSHDYLLSTGVPILFDLTNFHFIHYFIPYPTELVFQVLQNLAIIFSIFFIFSNEKISRYIAIIFYILISYLWGFIFRLGQEIDAVFLLQGSLLIFALLSYSESNTYYKKIRFLTIVVFVIYYFTSGLNKFIDLSYAQWFEFDLININKSLRLLYINENFLYIPKFPIDSSTIQFILNYFGAFITYVLHITCPLLLCTSSTKKIFFYWIFYSIFHYLTIYVGILFMMNFFAWLLILPIYKWIK